MPSLMKGWIDRVFTGTTFDQEALSGITSKQFMSFTLKQPVFMRLPCFIDGTSF